MPGQNNSVGGPSLSPGFRVGHWTHSGGTTGCTVVLPPAGNVCGYDLRGSAPGSRELASLDLSRQRSEVHAILLTGGSAHGLAAADGVMRWLEERGIGFATPVATIPIVPAAVIFDLAAGDPAMRPGPTAGYEACDAATEGPVPTGRVGAGAGATIGKWAGREYFAPGGLGVASARDGELEVAAIAVVNAIGDVMAADGSVLAGTSAPIRRFRPPAEEPSATMNTVLAVVTTVAPLSKPEAHFLAARASDGITKTIDPVHTRYDGDTTFAIAIPSAGDRAVSPRDIDVLGVLATQAVGAAIRAGVAPA